MRELIEEEIEQLRLLKNNADFKLYLVLLQDEFNSEYKKLRKCLRDNTFYKTQGCLDGLDKAKALVDSIVQEHNHNP